jgi:hypothetical protein
MYTHITACAHAHHSICTRTSQHVQTHIKHMYTHITACADAHHSICTRTSQHVQTHITAYVHAHHSMCRRTSQHAPRLTLKPACPPPPGCALPLLLVPQVRRHTEAAAEELQRAADQEEQLTKAGAGELAVSTALSLQHRLLAALQA